MAVDWENKITYWKAEFGCSARPAVERATLDTAAHNLRMPASAKEMYSSLNGLYLNWFSILPVENPAKIKHTWNGVLRANSIHKSSFLEADADLLDRFFVFADIGEGKCGVIERATGSIWYEEGNDLVLTSLTLDQFIEACLMDARVCPIKGLTPTGDWQA